MFNIFKSKESSKFNKRTQTYTPSTHMSWYELKECLTNPVLRPEVSWEFNQLPEEIDIGKLGEIAEKMLGETINDSLHRERGTYVKVDVYDKLQAKKAEFAEIGTSFEVTINHTLENYSVYRYGDTSEKIAALIHTHPQSQQSDDINQLPSFLDISNLLQEDPNGPSISIIFTESNSKDKPVHWILIKTKDTKLKAFENLDKWVFENDQKFWEMFNRSNGSFEELEKLTTNITANENIGVYKSITNNKFQRFK